MSAFLDSALSRFRAMYGNPLWPKCQECGAGVRGYGLEDAGKMLGGQYYFDVRAWCHGHTKGNGDQVHRVIHPDTWLRAKKSGEIMVDQMNVKAVVSLMTFYDDWPRKRYTVDLRNNIKVESWV